MSASCNIPAVKVTGAIVITALAKTAAEALFTVVAPKLPPFSTTEPAPVILNVDEDKSHNLKFVYALDVFVVAVDTVQLIISTEPVAEVAEIIRFVIFSPLTVQPFEIVNVPERDVFLPIDSCVVKTIY